MKRPISLILYYVFCILVLFASISSVFAAYTDFEQVTCKAGSTCYAYDEVKTAQTLNGSTGVADGSNPYLTGGWGQRGTSSTTYNTGTGFITDTDTTWSNNALNFSIIKGGTDLIFCFTFNDTGYNCVGGTRWKIVMGSSWGVVSSSILCNNDAPATNYKYFDDVTYSGIVAESTGIHRACLWFNTTDNHMRAKIDTTTIDTGDIYNPFVTGNMIWFDGYNGNPLKFGNVTLWNYTKYGLETPPVMAGGIDAAPSAPTYSYPTPTDGNHTNTQTIINCTHPGTDIGFYFYVNNERYFANVSKVGSGFNFTTNFTTDLNYTYSCGVINRTSGLYSANTTRSLIYDTVKPQIKVNTNINNDIFFATYDKNFTINILYNDSELFGFETYLDNVLVDNKSNLISDVYWYNFTYRVSNLSVGKHTFNFTVFDGHTLAFIPPQNVETTLSKDIIFKESSKSTDYLKISPKQTSLFDSFNAVKLPSKYIWQYERNVLNDNPDFTLIYKSNDPIELVQRPSNKYVGWAVVTKQRRWIDANTPNKYDDILIKQIDGYTIEVTYKNIQGDILIFESTGMLNIDSLILDFYVLNSTLIYQASMIGNEFQYVNITINKTGYPYDINISLMLDSVERSGVESVSTNFMNFSAYFKTPFVTNASEIKTFNLTFFGINASYQTFLFNQTVYNINFDNCTNSSWFNVLSFHGRDEVTDENVTTKLNINFLIWVTNDSDGSITHFELRNKVRYDFCVWPNTTSYTINAISEYGDGDYVDRKYYLVNYLLNASVHNDIYLYHLNSTKSTTIGMYVYDQNTLQRVPDVYIKIQRYYPEENIYKTVEIEKTDELGQTIAKMTLYDVFYKYILEYPAGTIKLNTEVQKVFSDTKTFYLSLTTNYLDTWTRIHDVSTSVTCTKATKTCRFEWSDASNVVQSGTLKVYRDEGIYEELLYEGTTSSTAATLTYTITEDTTGNMYRAEGYLESNTGTSWYGAGAAFLDYFKDTNPLFSNGDSKIANLFPLLMLTVCLVFAFVDFGAIGITFGALLALVIGFVAGILPISLGYLSSFIGIGIILIYKLKY